ncbi:MAG: hypothetical protein ACXVRH_08005 [Thermoleophilaceae bacterium]
MKHRLPAFLVALIALLACAPLAQAAFAPRVSLSVDPATPGARPAIEATVFETAGDTPPKRFTLAFPAGFALQHPSGVKACKPRQRRAARCRQDSEIGSLEAVTLTGARLRGTVNLARHGRQRQIIGVVKGRAAGLPNLSFVGYARMSPAGTAQVTLDGLPNVPLVSLTVRLTGGKRGLVSTPKGCGAQVVQGLLTSQLGELAVGLSAVQIAGC